MPANAGDVRFGALEKADRFVHGPVKKTHPEMEQIEALLIAPRIDEASGDAEPIDSADNKLRLVLNETNRPP